VSFADLDQLSEAQIADIKRKGTVVIKDVVDDDQARAWKASLEEFVKANPQSDVLIIKRTRVPRGR
jgi:anti-anti-sigma regulatory factor